MNRVKALSRTVFAFLAACMLFSYAQAQVPRVYISGKVTSNTSGCGSLTNPCKTLAYVLSNSLVSAGGEVVALDSGTYDTGGVTISMPLTVSAPTGISAGFSAGTGAAITVSAGSSDVVVLRGLTLNGGGAGIDFTSGGSLHVDNCLITGFTNYGLYATGGSKLFVKDSEIRGTVVNFIASGIYLDPSAAMSVYLDRCRLENNAIVGLYAGNYVKAVVRNSLISGSDSGLWLGPYSTGVPGHMVVDQCQIVNNNIGVRSDGVSNGHDLRLINSTVARNTYSLEAYAPGKIYTRVDGSGVKTNTVEGNTNAPSTTPSTFLVK
jgi:hypothetical protein